MSNNEQLQCKTAIVTGGASGMGFEIAKWLLREGAKVALFDINDEAVKRAAKELSDSGDQVIGVTCDVASLSNFETAYGMAVNSLGPVDLLINNAGWSPNKPFIETTVEEWERIIGINYLGVLNGCKTALGQMIELRRGRVINIASDAARVGTPREAVYAGAKAAVIGFSKSLAAEVAKYGITVNVVCPGSTDTPLLKDLLTQDQLDRRIKANPMGRIGRPEDIAAAVMFFAGQSSEYITGQVLSVNGGISRVG